MGRRQSPLVAALVLVDGLISCGVAPARVSDAPPAASARAALDAGAATVSSEAAPLSACRAPWGGGKPLGDVPAPGRLGEAAPASEVAYAHARHEYAAAQWDRAATEFRSIAFGYPDEEVGLYAAEMYLNALSMLTAYAERASCRDEIASEGARLNALYCDARRAASAEGCRRLLQAMDQRPRDIVWNWKGTFNFMEWGAGCPKDCVRYRVVIETCPGPCKVHVDVDGPKGSQRLDGVAVGNGTGDHDVLDVRFEAYRGAPPADAPLARGVTLFTLEAAPGDHMVLAFVELRSSDGRHATIADHVSLSRRK